MNEATVTDLSSRRTDCDFCDADGWLCITESRVVTDTDGNTAAMGFVKSIPCGHCGGTGMRADSKP